MVPPINNLLKLNIDGASKGNHGLAGCGDGIKDSNCNLIFVFSKFLNYESNNFVDVSALYTRLLVCYQLGITKIQVENRF